MFTQLILGFVLMTKKKTQKNLSLDDMTCVTVVVSSVTQAKNYGEITVNYREYR